MNILETMKRCGVLVTGSDLAAVEHDDGGVSFNLPLEIVSEANAREHWAARYRRAKRQKGTAFNATLRHTASLRQQIEVDDGIRLAITLVRIMRRGQRKFDGDNLQSGFKSARDGIAAALGIDDGSDRLDFRYDQEKGGGLRGGVRVTIARIDI